MANETLGAALEREHREIDNGLEAFASALAEGESRTQPLMDAIHALRRHIYLEEQLLFPQLQQGGTVAAIFVMLREHGEIWRSLGELEAGVSNGAERDSLLDIHRKLAAQLEAHNMKEEQILYSRADGVMDTSSAGDVAAFLESGQMPDGWACARA